MSELTRPAVFRERAKLDKVVRSATGKTQQPKGVSCFCHVMQSTTTMIDSVALKERQVKKTAALLPFSHKM